MLTLQQRRNLEKAVRAATTAPSASNPLVTAAEQPWEESANVVRVKSGFGASGCRVGTDATTATVDAYAEWDAANKGSNVSWSTNAWGNSREYADLLPVKQTSNSSPYAITVDSDYGGAVGDAPWKAFDTTGDATFWLGTACPSFIRIDLGASPISAAYYDIAGRSASGGNTPMRWILYGSNDANTSPTNWTVLDDRSASDNVFSPNYGPSSKFQISSPGSYRHYKLYVTKKQDGTTSGYTQISNITFYSYNYYTTLNTVPTPNLVTGTQSFSPSTLKLYTTTSMLTELNNGEATVSFKKIIGGVTTDYGAQESLTTFRSRPASEFANCTSLFLKVAPVGAYTVGGLTIETTSSSIVSTKAGEVTISVNGSTVYQVQTDGDVITADITADDISMTGNLVRGDGIRTISTVIDGTVTTTDDSNTTAYTYAVAEDKTVTLEVEAIGMESGTNNRNSYKLRGTFYRNGSGALAQLGDLVSIDTNEAVTARDCTFVVSSNNVLLRVVGTAATTVYWTYTLKIVLGE